jgi:hypothetical protein
VKTARVVRHQQRIFSCLAHSFERDAAGPIAAFLKLWRQALPMLIELFYKRLAIHRQVARNAVPLK